MFVQGRKDIYLLQMVRKEYDANVKLFTELLDMGDYLKTPIRQLSLGQRMKVEISLALFHKPRILYLNEPTIGLTYWQRTIYVSL
jgi:ABC-2 type transport system ATP-binding protein